ncbi:MAG: hypothetical protein JRN20_04265 [Nitrososphaerota archaeon]|nr:hypothetical protein [Nitrososphaerota archaeon]MDG6922406.1 hypothetical protein [Nitrososphaerota archaeon]
MARTNISVDSTVFDQFSKEAERHNKTLFAFANETLSAVSKISSEGGSPSQLYPVWRSLSILRQIDVITLPSDFVDDLIEKIYLSSKETALRMFRDLGSSVVGLLRIAADDLDGLASLAKDFALIIPVKQFKVNKEGGEGDVEIDVVGAGRKVSSTECTFAFLKAILNGYGYSVTMQEIGVGTLRIWASLGPSVRV